MNRILYIFNKDTTIISEVQLFWKELTRID